MVQQRVSSQFLMAMTGVYMTVRETGAYVIGGSSPLCCFATGLMNSGDALSVD